MDLYRIKAINKFEINKNTSTFHKHLHQQYGLITVDYDGNLPFKNKPTEEEVLSCLKLLKPTNEYFIGGMEIEFIRELKTNEK